MAELVEIRSVRCGRCGRQCEEREAKPLGRGTERGTHICPWCLEQMRREQR